MKKRTAVLVKNAVFLEIFAENEGKRWILKMNNHFILNLFIQDEELCC